MFCIHGLEDLILLTWQKAILPEMTYRVNAISMKSHLASLQNWQYDSKIIWQSRGFRMAQIILKKKYKVGGCSDFKTHKSIIIKILWYLHKGRHTVQWSGIVIAEINTHIYFQ